MSKGKGRVCLLSAIVVLTTISFGATSDRLANGISGAPVALRGHVHRLAQPQFDLGRVSPSLQLGTMTLMTVPTPAQQQALDRLVADQQNPKSSNYHKWLTPEQYADRFGLSQRDIQQLVTWLTSQGFTNVNPARGRNWISFTGTAAQAEAAFSTEIHSYNVNGDLHYANSKDLRVPASIVGVATGVRGLTDFRPRPRAHRRALPQWASTKYGNFVAPGDIGTIYDINALYSAGIDGTGQTLAVMGQTDIYLADLQKFRTGFGLSNISCTAGTTGLITACSDPHFKYLLTGTDPGPSTNGDIGEADLDIEWSGAVARGAQIIYVNSSDTFTSYYYAIDNKVSPVISLSYGFCEWDDQFIVQDEAELQKANSEGITFVNSSGDSGAAECDFFQTLTNTNLATQGLAVSYPASSQYVTGVGGTGVTLAAWTDAQYWGTTNGTNGGTALSYVPEQVWNDDLEIYQFCQLNPTSLFCTQGGSTAQPGWVNITSEAAAQTDIGLSSTGGGASNCELHTNSACTANGGFPKPSWQTVTVSGISGVRMSPDISFFASPNFPGYVFCTPLSEISSSTSSTSSCNVSITDAVDTHLSIIGGTSASAPVFAGIVTLLNQYLVGTSSNGLGNVNPMLYQLAASSPSAFHQVTSGDNNAYCSIGTPAGQLPALQCPNTGVIGYSAATKDATTGYNLVAGLGSLDVNNFFSAWAASRTATTTGLAVSNATPFQGESVNLTATISPSSATGTVTFKSGTTSIGTATLASGVATLATSSLPLGTNSITATYMGNATLNTSTSSASTVTIASAFTMAPTAASFQVAQGSNVNATVTVTFTSGFTGPVTFTCSDTVALSTCTPPTQGITATGDVSFNITTTAPTAKLQRPLDRNMKIFYAAFLPGMFGILFVGSRKRSTRGMRLLGLIMVLGMSTMWMASCGGSGSGGTTGNPGTPKGTYTINVTGTGSGATATTSFQLVVQ